MVDHGADRRALEQRDLLGADEDRLLVLHIFDGDEQTQRRVVRAVGYVEGDVELIGTQSEVDMLGEDQGELDET